MNVFIWKSTVSNNKNTQKIIVAFFSKIPWLLQIFPDSNFIPDFGQPSWYRLQTYQICFSSESVPAGNKIWWWSEKLNMLN